MLTLLLLKSYLGRIYDFCSANWRICLFGLILGVAFYYKYRYTLSVEALATFKQEIATLSAQQEAKNVLMKQSSAILAKSTQVAYETQIASLSLDRKKLTQDLANDKDTLNSMLNDAYQLRLNNGGSSSSKVSSTTELLTESERNINTVATLIKSCQQTTIDYNTLYKSWTDNCAIYGCE